MTLRNSLPVRPFYGAQVNAGSSCVIDWSSRNLDNELEAPTVLEYRIDDLTDSVVILGWTEIAEPSTTGQLVISAATNDMQYQYREQQLNQVTFRATYANGQQIQSMAYYTLCAVFQVMRTYGLW